MQHKANSVSQLCFYPSVVFKTAVKLYKPVKILFELFFSFSYAVNTLYLC